MKTLKKLFGRFLLAVIGLVTLTVLAVLGLILVISHAFHTSEVDKTTYCDSTGHCHTETTHK